MHCGSPRREGTIGIYEEVMVQNFPNLTEYMHLYIKEAKETPK